MGRSDCLGFCRVEPRARRGAGKNPWGGDLVDVEELGDVRSLGLEELRNVSSLGPWGGDLPGGALPREHAHDE